MMEEPAQRQAGATLVVSVSEVEVGGERHGARTCGDGSARIWAFALCLAEWVDPLFRGLMLRMGTTPHTGLPLFAEFTPPVPQVHGNHHGRHRVLWGAWSAVEGQGGYDLEAANGAHRVLLMGCEGFGD